MTNHDLAAIQPLFMSLSPGYLSMPFSITVDAAHWESIRVASALTTACLAFCLHSTLV
ncbi:hypothetical protein [Cernens ardua]|uniref:hypothetical protein n=1 Tax=Cernens ardua TaxID=3402176 RepID=UPI003F96D453